MVRLPTPFKLLKVDWPTLDKMELFFFSFSKDTLPHWHTAALYLPGSRHRWRYSVNFNTQILNILSGCELLSNTNWCLARSLFTFRPAGHCRRRSLGRASLTGHNCPLPVHQWFSVTALRFFRTWTGPWPRLAVFRMNCKLCKARAPLLSCVSVLSCLWWFL